MKLRALASAAVLCAIVLPACGSGGGSSPSGATTGPGENAASKAEPSAEFAGKGANGELAKAGEESSAGEREAASTALEEDFEARAAGDWAAQCETLAPVVIKEVEKRATKGILVSDCATVLKQAGEKAPKASRENPMPEPLAALRVNGNQAFAFFHGTGSRDYVIPMEKVAGAWKVAALSPQEAP